jgi:hypothetical protein
LASSCLGVSIRTATIPAIANPADRNQP